MPSLSEMGNGFSRSRLIVCDHDISRNSKIVAINEDNRRISII
jgi:hypothetical protein